MAHQEITTFRTNESALKAYETLRPLCTRIRRTIRVWWMSMIYLWVVLAVILYYSKDYAQYTFWALIVHALICLLLYFKNNKRNGWMYSVLKEYDNVKKLKMLAHPYNRLLKFTYAIIIIDFFLWPVSFPIKIVFFVFYKMFRSRMRRLKRLIIKGEIILVPDEDEIAKDPFYSFLLREGLYESSLEFAEDDDLQIQAQEATDEEISELEPQTEASNEESASEEKSAVDDESDDWIDDFVEG